jgi:hypothetical protein
MIVTPTPFGRDRIAIAKQAANAGYGQLFSKNHFFTGLYSVDNTGDAL